MATVERADREIADLRRQLAHEREQLAADIAAIRDGSSPVDVLRRRLPLVAAGAFTGGFVLAGGIGATFRLIFRRGREGEEVARLGRYVVLLRD